MASGASPRVAQRTQAPTWPPIPPQESPGLLSWDRGIPELPWGRQPGTAAWAHSGRAQLGGSRRGSRQPGRTAHTLAQKEKGSCSSEFLVGLGHATSLPLKPKPACPALRLGVNSAAVPKDPGKACAPLPRPWEGDHRARPRLQRPCPEASSACPWDLAESSLSPV